MISYKIKTTAPKRYCVRPNFGFVRPSGEEEIVVMLQPGPTNEKHKFQVQSIIVPMDFADKPKEDQMKDWSNKEYLPSADTKLACVFVELDDIKSIVSEDDAGIVTANEQTPEKKEFLKQEPVSQESVEKSVEEEKVHQHQQQLPTMKQEQSTSVKAARTSSTSSSSPRDAEEIKRLRAALEEANNKIRALSSTAPDASDEENQARQKQIIIYIFIAFMIGFFIGCVL